MDSAGVREEINDAAALRVNAGVVGDQPDVLVAQRGEFLRFQNIQARLHATWTARAFRGSAFHRRCEEREQCPEKHGDKNRAGKLPTSRWVIASSDAHASMILWNLACAPALFG